MGFSKMSTSCRRRISTRQIEKNHLQAHEILLVHQAALQEMRVQFLALKAARIDALEK